MPTDGFIALSRGMHEELAPLILSEQAYARGINIVSRGGLIRTRPAFQQNAPPLPALPPGRFQGAALYSLEDDARIVVVVSGVLYQVKVSSWTVGAVAGVSLKADRPCYFCQADKYMIVQDGESWPAILNEDAGYQPDPNAHSADPAPFWTVPTGTKMAYGHGRIYVVVPTVGSVADLGERFFEAGDVLWTGDVDYDGTNVPNVLKFVDAATVATGGAFSLPDELGFITGMKFLRNAQTGTDFGALLVFARNGVSAFSVNIPRAQWLGLDGTGNVIGENISQVLFSGFGTYAHRALVNVNNDIYVRGRDGLRTVGFSVSQGQSATVASLPMSEEVASLLAVDGYEEQLEASAAVADHRFCVLAGGRRSATGEMVFDRMIVLDGQTAATLGGGAEYYDGAWCGLDMLQVLSVSIDGRDRIVVFRKEADTSIGMSIVGDDCSDEELLPVCRLYTRAFGFPSMPLLNFRKLKSVTILLDELRGSVTAAVYFRPWGRVLWTAMGAAVIKAGADGERRRPLRFTVPDVACENGLLLDVAEAFQFCLEIVGRARLCGFFVEVDEGSETYVSACDTTETAAQAQAGGIALEDSDLDYRISP